MRLLEKVQIAPCLILISVLFSFSVLNAQVTYQNNVRDNGDANNTVINIFNFHVPAGNNRLIVVSVGSHTASGNNSLVTGITFNSQNFTKATSVVSVSQNSEIWYLVLSGTSIIQEDLVVSFSQPYDEAQAIAASYTGVESSNPIGSTDTQGGFGTTGMLTLPTASGHLVVDCVQRNNGLQVTFGANQTALSNTAYSSSQTGASYESATGSSVEMSWSASVSARFAYSAVELNQAPVLPVELKYFRAHPNSQSVNLAWATATEINNDYFTIERSVNGTNYDPIGKVKGAGSSYEELTYSFVDKQLPEGNTQLYYRLRQTDFDGTSKIEKVVSVDLLNFHSLVNLVTVYPNPTSDILNIRFNENIEEGRLEMYNELGQKFLESDLNHSSNNTISVRGFPSGVYFLSLKMDGSNLDRRVIITD